MVDFENAHQSSECSKGGCLCCEVTEIKQEIPMGVFNGLYPYENYSPQDLSALNKNDQTESEKSTHGIQLQSKRFGKTPKVFLRLPVSDAMASSSFLDSTTFEVPTANDMFSENEDGVIKKKRIISTLSTFRVGKDGVHSQTNNESDNVENPFKCHICGKTWKDMSHLKRHLQTHNPVKRFQCQFCPGAFKDKYGLALHTRTRHPSERPFVCPIPLCNLSFTSNRSLNRHVETHSEPGEKKIFHCKKCNECFPDRSALKNHKLSCENEEKKDIGCDICGKLFANASTLRVHRLRHDESLKKFKCDACNVSFLWPSLLRLHLQSKNHLLNVGLPLPTMATPL